MKRRAMALENAMWVDGQILPLATALFRYQQPFGRFEGTLRLQGQTVRVTGSGVVEQHWATW